MTTRATTPTCIADVMTREPTCASPEMTVRELAMILDTNEISGVPVVDAQDRVVGVVSKSDLLHYCLDGALRSDRSFFESLTGEFEDDELREIDVEEFGVVEDFMSPDPVTVLPQDSIPAVARRMSELGIHRVIVTGAEDRVEGIVSALDLLGSYPEG